MKPSPKKPSLPITAQTSAVALVLLSKSKTGWSWRRLHNAFVAQSAKRSERTALAGMLAAAVCAINSRS